MALNTKSWRDGLLVEAESRPPLNPLASPFKPRSKTTGSDATSDKTSQDAHGTVFAAQLIPFYSQFYSAETIVRWVTITVGSETFRLLAAVAMQSPKLKQLILEAWAGIHQNHVYIVLDADPELFSYILRWLRRGTYPLFWDVMTGHNYGKYYALSHEARYLGLGKLAKWLDRKGYEDILGVRERREWYRDIPRLCDSEQGALYESNKVVQYVVAEWEESLWVCPAGKSLEEHRRECGKGDHRCGPDRERVSCEKGVGVMRVVKEAIFHGGLLDR